MPVGLALLVCRVAAELVSLPLVGPGTPVPTAQASAGRAKPPLQPPPSLPLPLTPPAQEFAIELWSSWQLTLAFSSKTAKVREVLPESPAPAGHKVHTTLKAILTLLAWNVALISHRSLLPSTCAQGPALFSHHAAKAQPRGPSWAPASSTLWA